MRELYRFNFVAMRLSGKPSLLSPRVRAGKREIVNHFPRRGVVDDARLAKPAQIALAGSAALTSTPVANIAGATPG